MGLADQDLITMPLYPVRINKRTIEKRVRVVEAYDASTVGRQHSRDRSVSHGHALQLSAVQLRIPHKFPMFIVSMLVVMEE